MGIELGKILPAIFLGITISPRIRVRSLKIESLIDEVDEFGWKRI